MSYLIEEAHIGGTIFTAPGRRSGVSFKRRKKRSLHFGRIVGGGRWRSFCGRSSFPHPLKPVVPRQRTINISVPYRMQPQCNTSIRVARVCNPACVA